MWIHSLLCHRQLILCWLLTEFASKSDVKVQKKWFQGPDSRFQRTKFLSVYWLLAWSDLPDQAHKSRKKKWCCSGIDCLCLYMAVRVGHLKEIYGLSPCGLSLCQMIMNWNITRNFMDEKIKSTMTVWGYTEEFQQLIAILHRNDN